MKELRIDLGPDAAAGRRCRMEDHVGQIAQLGEDLDAARKAAELGLFAASVFPCGMREKHVMSDKLANPFGGIKSPSDLTLGDLMELHDRLIHPEDADPVEIRAGSMLAVHSVAAVNTHEDVSLRFYGLPVIVDEAMPFNRIEVRARDGSVVATLDLG